METRTLRPRNIKPGMLTHPGKEAVMTDEERNAVAITEKLVKQAKHPALSLIQRGHKIVSQGCGLFRCVRCGGHFDRRDDWSKYCEPKK